MSESMCNNFSEYDFETTKKLVAKEVQKCFENYETEQDEDKASELWELWDAMHGAYSALDTIHFLFEHSLEPCGICTQEIMQMFKAFNATKA